MEYLALLGVLALSAAGGALLDSEGVDSPPLYWGLGAITGLLAMALAVVI